MTDPLTLVLTMGQVGSQSVHEALVSAEMPGRAMHIHSVNPHGLGRAVQRAGGLSKAPRSVQDGLDAVRLLLRHPGRPKVVTLVREPVSRNMSAAFASLRAKLLTPGAVADYLRRDEAAAEWYADFYDRRPFTWFGAELEEQLGIDVYDAPFPEAGWRAFQTPRFDVLILRTELPDEAKAAVLGTFFERAPIIVPRINIGNRSDGFGPLYDRFKATLGLSTEYLSGIAAERYTRHFYP